MSDAENTEPTPEKEQQFGTEAQPLTFPMALQVGGTKVVLYANGAAEVDTSALEEALTAFRGQATLETLVLWQMLRTFKTTVRA